MRFLGVDLAWAARNPSGVAVLAGARFPLRLDDGPGTLPTHAATLDWLAGWLDRPGRRVATAIGIDAPLLGLAGAGGRRPCDDDVSRLFGRFHASTHSLPRAPDLAGFTAHLRRRHGARSFAPDVRPAGGRPAIREVYPNALQVLLFDLARRGGTIVPYKRRRFRGKRAWVTRGLRPFIGRCRRVLEAAYVDRSAPAWQALVARGPRVTMTGAELKAIEDRWDAVLCAVAVALEHLAPGTMRAYAGGRAGWRGGYILAPALMPRRRQLAKLACVPRGPRRLAAGRPRAPLAAPRLPDHDEVVIRQADVVVIGSGGFGAATAYFLMRRGGRRVVLLDRHALASQTSPRAAGNAAVLRSTDLMSRLAGRAVDWLLRLTADTGEPLEIVRSGSLKAARTAEDAVTLAREASRGEQLGLETRLVSPEAAHRMHPFFEPPRGPVGPSYAGRRLLRALPRRERLRGRRGQAGRDAAAEHDGHRVDARDGAVQGVETDRGRIESPVVVDARRGLGASGRRGRRGPRPDGSDAPPGAHHGADRRRRRSCPSCGSWTPRSYVRPCWGGFLAGGYETEPTQFEMERLPASFSIADTPARPRGAAPADGGRARPAARAARRRPCGSTGAASRR